METTNDKKSSGKGSEQFTKIIENHLAEYAKKDKLFEKSLKKENKNIDDCITYILNYVRESDMIGFADEEIYKLARHYYDEDDIDPGKPVLNIDIKWNESKLPSEKELEEIKEKVRQEIFQEEKEKRTKNKKVVRNIGTAKVDNQEPQTSLF